MQAILPFLLLLFSLMATAQNYPDLVAYYSFDNCDLTDETDFGGDGTIYGDPECVEGISGNALYFNGDDYAHFYEAVNDFFGTQDFTYSFFLKGVDLSSNSHQSVLGKRTHCNGYNQFDARIVNSGEIRCAIAGDNNNWQTSSINAEITQECWEQITFVREGVNTFVYINGELLNSGSANEILDINNNAFLAISDSPCIGFDGTVRLTGTIDELRIYSKALTDTEVLNLFDSYNEEYTNACKQVETVPTLSEWGLILLSILSMIYSTLVIGNGTTSLATISSNIRLPMLNTSIPFSKQHFNLAFILTIILTTIGFLFSIILYGNIFFSDIIGIAFTAPVFAYYIHLILLLQRE